MEQIEPPFYPMPIMGKEICRIIIESHLSNLFTMCKKAKKYYLGDDAIDIFKRSIRLEIPNYLIVSFYPTEGKLLLTTLPENTQSFLEFFNHIWACKHCNPQARITKNENGLL